MLSLAQQSCTRLIVGRGSPVPKIQEVGVLNESRSETKVLRFSLTKFVVANLKKRPPLPLLTFKIVPTFDVRLKPLLKMSRVNLKVDAKVVVQIRNLYRNQTPDIVGIGLRVKFDRETILVLYKLVF